MLRKKIHHEGGFTIVELMVAIAIIAIVAAISIPAFLNQRKKGYDKTLENDMATAAMVIKDWSLRNSWDKFRAIAASKGYDRPDEVNLRDWNTLAAMPDTGLPKIDVDPSSWIVFIYKNPATFTPTGWTHPHEDGDFCVTGRNTKSNYNYPGGNAARYNEQLYWDQMQGGVKTIDELVTTRNNASGAQLSCSGWVNAYKSATGK